MKDGKKTSNAQRPTPNVEIGKRGNQARSSYLVFWQCPSYGPLMGNVVLTVGGWRIPTVAEIEELRARIREHEGIPNRYFVAICSLMKVSRV